MIDKRSAAGDRHQMIPFPPSRDNVGIVRPMARDGLAITIW
jgi:hypothetical protein